MRRIWRSGVSRRSLVSGAASLALAAGLLAPRAARASARVQGMRFGDHGTSTRFVLDLSERARWRLFTLAAPYRLVLDIPAAEFVLATVPSGLGLIQSARHGMADSQTARVVLDLSGPVVVDKDFLLEPQGDQGWRLVIDLAPTSDAVFMASVGLPTAPEAPNTLTPEPSTRAVAMAGTSVVGTPVGGGYQGPIPKASTPAMSVATTPGVTASGAPLDLRGFTAARIGGGSIEPLPTPMASGETGSMDGALGVPDALSPGLSPVGQGMPIVSRLGPMRVGLADGRVVPVPMDKPTQSVAPPRRPVIVLDPGHGGRDPGAIGLTGVHEKDITLNMARDLRKALEATGRYKVVMTRDRDSAIHLRERVARGRHAGADLFISLHADALRDPGVRGLSVYTLSENASDDEAAQLAERENKADILLGMDLSHESPDVANILIDLAQRETKNKSVRFANALISQLPADVKKLGKTRRYAGFAVLKAPDVPSVLVEMGFLSNRSDEKLLRTNGYRVKLAAALVRSVDDFFAPQQQRAWRP
ncbi:MAG: N-acetylmuramoyl-L-alanine amidase [Rhodospirillum sp.]|nr:N-acetylmuramoyl-L-alanine amidase [Rhodospirillum sp.]MCF8490588.1 N-acetylmuramoyl-L-alanine amidase [Rhodospirillum sp.]